MLHVLENENLLDFVKLNNAINFSLVVVLEGIEVRCKSDFVEEKVNLKSRQRLLGNLCLEKGFDEGPKNNFVNDTVNCACFLLILKKAHFTGVNAQPKISCIQNSDPTKIVAFEI